MISFGPTEEQEVVREMLRGFADEAIRPLARDADETSAIPDGLLQTAWELGLTNTQIPESYGGGGEERSPLTNALVLEELAYGDAALALAVVAVLELDVSAAEASILARLSGSGSAARSVIGGYVEWPVGDDGKAVSIAEQDHWDLRDVVGRSSWFRWQRSHPPRAAWLSESRCRGPGHPRDSWCLRGSRARRSRSRRGPGPRGRCRSDSRADSSCEVRRRTSRSCSRCSRRRHGARSRSRSRR